MIILIKSDNQNLSYILSKNPASGLCIKSLRQGFCLGKFIDDTVYGVAFEEMGDSFEKEGNYLTYKGYCSAEAALSTLTSLFDCIKKDNTKQYEVEESTNTITIKCIDVSNIKVNDFNTSDFNITINVISEVVSELVLSNKGSLVDLLRYTSLLLFMSVLKEHSSYHEGDQIKVYATLISKTPFIPFLVRHKFRGLLETSQSKKMVPLLNNEFIKLSNIGRNEDQRKAFVSQHVKFSTVLDIGCGPGKYIKTSKATKYIGVDINEDELRRAENKSKYLAVEAFFYSDWKVALETLTEPTTVLLIEFIEHIDKEEGLKIVTALIENTNVKQILISTPNKDFNKYFNIAEGQVRYEDHIYEMTEEEFNTFPGENIKWGDSVNECPMTLYKNIEFEDENINE